jgi:hypothetical protein
MCWIGYMFHRNVGIHLVIRDIHFGIHLVIRDIHLRDYTVHNTDNQHLNYSRRLSTITKFGITRLAAATLEA